MKQFGTSVLVISTVFLAVATVFVALRLVSRIFVARKVTLSDYIMLVSWVLVSALSVAIIYATTKGLGLREGVLIEWREPLAKAEYAFTVLYNPALTGIKSSILIFYLTLSEGQSLFRRGTCLTLGLVNVTGLVLTLVNIVQCRPIVAAIQVPSRPGAQCIDIVALYISSAPVNIITDIAIFVLPMPTLWRMRLPRKQKIILLLTFGTGLFITINSVIRTEYLLRLAIIRVTKPHPPGVHDLSYYDAYLFMWSAIELNLGIICACVPSLKPLVARILPYITRNPREAGGSSEWGPIASHSTRSPPGPSLASSPANDTDQARTKHAQDTTHDTGASVAVHEASNSSAETSGSRQSGAEGTASRTANHAPFFDFVRLMRPKSMLKLSNQESLVPIAVVCVIYFLWGFAYGFIDVLNLRFRQAAHYDLPTTFELHAAYFGAYVFGPMLVAMPILKRWGFKATIITGLLIYSCGTLVFWPAAVLISLPAFVVSNFIVGLGLSVVETAADLFVTLCGPVDYAEMRLNIAQGVQAVSAIVSPIIAQQILFGNVDSAPALISVQWTYLVITIVAILMALTFNFLQLPEASNEELTQLADRRREDYCSTICGIRVVWVTLALGAISQFCNTGGQENLQTKFRSFETYNEPNPYPPAFGLQAIGHTLFAIGHFLAAFAQLFLKPRRILLGLYLGTVLFSALSMTMTGYTGITMGLLLFLFNGGIFSITFAICLRGMGKHTKTAASIMTMAVSGGAPFPVIQNIIATSHGIRYAFCVSVALFSVGAVFPLYLNLVPTARKQVDPGMDYRHLHIQFPAPRMGGLHGGLELNRTGRSVRAR